MMTLSITLEVRPEKHQELWHTLYELLKENCHSKGFMGGEIRIAAENEHHITLVEKWGTQEALDEYMTSERFTILKGALQILTISASITTFPNLPHQEYPGVGLHERNMSHRRQEAL